MKSKSPASFIISGISLIFASASCNTKQPYKPDYSNMAGYVIGKETCNTDDTNDYWLLDFNVYPNSPQIGDTLVLNSIPLFSEAENKFRC